jgi:hypothetical protein
MRRIMGKICDEQKVKFLVPIIDVATRWNSTFDMLVRTLEYKSIITDTIYRSSDDKLIKLRLKEEDWECVGNLIGILNPFKVATLEASKSGSCLMITNVIPLYHFATLNGEVS